MVTEPGEGAAVGLDVGVHPYDVLQPAPNGILGMNESINNGLQASASSAETDVGVFAGAGVGLGNVLFSGADVGFGYNSGSNAVAGLGHGVGSNVGNGLATNTAGTPRLTNSTEMRATSSASKCLESVVAITASDCELNRIIAAQYNSVAPPSQRAPIKAARK